MNNHYDWGMVLFHLCQKHLTWPEGCEEATSTEVFGHHKCGWGEDGTAGSHFSLLNLEWSWSEEDGFEVYNSSKYDGDDGAIINLFGPFTGQEENIQKVKKEFIEFLSEKQNCLLERIKESIEELKKRGASPAEIYLYSKWIGLLGNKLWGFPIHEVEEEGGSKVISEVKYGRFAPINLKEITMRDRRSDAV